MHLSIQLTEAKIYFASRIASKDQNSDEHSKETRPNLKPKIEVTREHEKGLTVGSFLTMGFSVELMEKSSRGGGNTFPDRRCILFVVPVIC
jgi:hypothetical protein